MDKRLLNTKTVVTGGSRGIGAGIVKRLFNEGSEIIIADILEDEANDLIKSLEAKDRIFFHRTNLAEENQILDLFKFVKDKWGTLNFLINNAGIEDGFLVKDQSYEDYKKTIRINMDAPFLCSKYVLPLFKINNGGRIIMISSIQGIRGYKGNISYNTAKGGMINMTRVLSTELANENILVNSVAPGFINTDMSLMKDGTLEWDSDWFKDVYIKYEKLPMGRYGNPDELITTALYLSCKNSSFVTGANIPVDGGWTLW